jgi:hypothetical protein
MTADREPEPTMPSKPSTPPGLCGSCRHSRRLETRAGSAFRLCERAATDPTYPRYPALPVVSCRGFEPVADPL